jgi:hypothetical protein
MMNKNYLSSNIFLAFLFLFLFYISNYLFLSELRDPNIFFLWWNQDQYLINYNDFGFVKRGLIGTIFNIDYINYKPYSKIIALTVVFFIVIIFLLILNNVENIQIKKFLLLLSFSPFLFLQLGYDFGRFDQFGIAFILLTFLFILKKKSIFILEVFAPFTILIHEIHFFSVVIFFIYIQIELKRKTLNICYVFLNSIIILIALFFFGGIDDETYQNFVDKYWFIKVYFSNGHIESYMSFWSDVFKFNTTIFYRHLVSILIFIYLLFFFIKKINSNKLTILILFFLPCFIIGIDHARFLSLFIINIYLIFFLILINKKDVLKIPPFKNYYFTIVLLGPWGINICLPILTIVKKAILYGTLTFD